MWFGGCLGLLLVKFRNIFRYKQVLRCWNVLKECFENVGTGFPVWRLFRSQRSMKISWNTKKKQDLKCLETFWQLIPVGIFDGWRWKITDLFWQLTVNPIKTFAWCTRVWQTSKQAASHYSQGRYQGRFPFRQNFRLEIPEIFRVKWKVFAPIYRATFAIYCLHCSPVTTSLETVFDKLAGKVLKISFLVDLPLQNSFFCLVFLPAWDKKNFVKVLPAS